jgi:transcriptional regulator GlxA family with amidase domain
MQKKNDFKGENEQWRRNRRLERIMEYLSNNLSKNLSASAVAEHFEMSVSSLEHLFKENLGQTYHQYVEDMRMVTAFDLITKEGMRVQQAMYATGFKYKSTFNTCFKRKFGHAPSYFKI